MAEVLLTQLILRGQNITALLTEAENYLTENPKNLDNLNEIEDKIHRKLSSISKALDKIIHYISQLPQAERPALEVRLDAIRFNDAKLPELMVELEDLRGRIKFEIKKLDGNSNGDKNGSSRSENSGSMHPLPVQLPRLSIAPFDGSFSKWPSFLQAFEDGVCSQNLTDGQKMNYLVGFMRGPAREMAEGYPITNDNFQILLP